MAKGPSPAVVAARSRRSNAIAAGRGRVRWEWFTENVLNKVSMTLRQRMMVTTQYLLAATVKNISVPVKTEKGPDGGRRVIERSKPGEFPRADSTLLRKTIFAKVAQPSRDIVIGYIGTPLDYGVILETRMDRSFLLRTLHEQHGRIVQILTSKPIT